MWTQHVAQTSLASLVRIHWHDLQMTHKYKTGRCIWVVCSIALVSRHNPRNHTDLSCVYYIFPQITCLLREPLKHLYECQFTLNKIIRYKGFVGGWSQNIGEVWNLKWVNTSKQQQKKRWRQGTSTFNKPALHLLLTSLLIINVLRLMPLQVLYKALCTTNDTRNKNSSQLRRCHSNYTFIHQWVPSLRHRRPKLMSHTPTSIITIWSDFRSEHVTY